MKFVCERCHTKYSIADDKVRGKVLKVRCKTCTNVITVRETGASVEDAPTAIDAGHAHSAPTAHADIDAKALFSSAPATTTTAAPAAVRAPASAASPARVGVTGGGAAPASNGAAARSSRGAGAPASAAALSGNGAQVSAAGVSPRRLTGSIAVPPPLPPDDLEWYLAVDGVQSGPFGRSVLVERVLTQPKTADVHVWNADLDGWKPPRDLPELAQEMLRRRRSLTPVPPPPPRRLFPTGNHPTADVAARANGEAKSETRSETKSETRFPSAASAPGTVEAKGPDAPGRPHPPGTTGGQGRGPSHHPSAPGSHAHLPGSGGGSAGAHPPGHSGKNGASNGVQAAGFAVDHLVGGDASAAISAAALPALLSSPVAVAVAVSAEAAAPVAGVNSSSLGVSGPVLHGPAALVARARSTRALVAGGAVLALVICGLIASAVLRHPATPVPAPVATKADPEKSAATNVAAMAEDMARQEAEAAAAAKAKAEPPPAPPAPIDSRVPVAARVEAAGPRPGRRAKRGGRSQPVSTVPPPVASGMTADQRDAAGRFGDSSGRELRLPGTSSSGARSTPVQADISRVINNNRQGIQTCYQRALLRDNSLTNGKITVRVTVGLSGRVQRVNLDATAPFRALEPCIRDVMSRWAFPPSSEEYQTEFPVVLAGNQ
jgi:predicted Zn finger-like uncharacterized protein